VLEIVAGGFDFRARYEERVTPRRGIRRKRLYAPAEPTATQNTDPGP